jgi:hypothetical protein
MTIHVTAEGRRCDGRTEEQIRRDADEVVHQAQVAARKIQLEPRATERRTNREDTKRRAEDIRQERNASSREPDAELAAAFELAAQKKKGRSSPAPSTRFDRSIYHVKGMGIRGVQGGAPGSGKR